ncbi:thermonuclease family protein [Aquamicrobium sp. LC103]|uniref:thermonuclease family protein n=1 Tax=Aquamicrobium sp. LC103 TaxID=1120658 RepID=UPI00069C452C|nr:thermonuclease family protein [Aquamicrobium sp. LC103]TKT74225.1 thermonuclease family protein [Aquamicrobium sp. LC103]
MRKAGIAVALTGLAAATLTGVFARDHILAVDLAAQKASEAATAARIVERPVPPPPPLPEVSRRIRPVVPDVVAAPPVGEGGLERVDPRDPLGPLGRARSLSEGPPKETILYRPTTAGAGRFEAQGYSVRLEGVQPTDVGENCTTPEGLSWPCGIHARTAFRNWLRGRALNCVVPPVPGQAEHVTGCTLGKEDAAEWLVSHGWVRAEPNGSYVEAEEVARKARLGLFGPAPITSRQSGD